MKSILVTSCYPNEGKSDVIFQLALEIGKMGKRVLVLDADIRKSSFVSRFQVKGKTEGLSRYLSNQCGVEDVVYNTNFPGVDIIFAGPIAPNPTELLEQALKEPAKAREILARPEMEKHQAWFEELQAQGAGEGDTRRKIQESIGQVFGKILGNAGVFKDTEEGREAFRRFCAQV